MAKVKEQIVAYKSKKARSAEKSEKSITWPRVTASQLRKLHTRERSRLLALQAKHAAGMFAAGNEEVIGSSSIDLEY